MRLKSVWQTARPDTCLSLIEDDDNALAIITGEASNVIVVDLDCPKPKDIEQGVQDAVKAIICHMLQTDPG